MKGGCSFIKLLGDSLRFLLERGFSSVFKQAVLCLLLFIFQLYSLNEYKPPISKAKMTQITKSGIKAIKVSMQCYRMRQVIEE